MRSASRRPAFAGACLLRPTGAPRPMRDHDDQRQNNLRRRIAEPERCRIRDADLRQRSDAAELTERDAERNQIDQRVLLAHRDRGPTRDEAAAEIDAGEEAVHVVEPRRGVGLPERHLQDAADERDRRHGTGRFGRCVGWPACGCPPLRWMLAHTRGNRETTPSSWPGLSRPSTSCFAHRMAGGWVYFMTNKRNGVLYAGVTSNLPKHAYEHREGLVDGFTKEHDLKRLVYYERHDTIQSAIQREK